MKTMFVYKSKANISDDACIFNGKSIENDVLKMQFSEAWKYLSRPTDIPIEIANNSGSFDIKASQLLSDLFGYKLKFGEQMESIQKKMTKEYLEKKDKKEYTDEKFNMIYPTTPKIPLNFVKSEFIENTIVKYSNPKIESKNPVKPLFKPEEYEEIKLKEQKGKCFAKIIKDRLKIESISINRVWLSDSSKSEELPPIMLLHNPDSNGNPRDFAIIEHPDMKSYMLCNEDLILKEGEKFPWTCATIAKDEIEPFSDVMSKRKFSFSTVENATQTPEPSSKIPKSERRKVLRGSSTAYMGSEESLKALLEPGKKEESKEEYLKATELGGIYNVKKIKGERNIRKSDEIDVENLNFYF